MDYNPNLNVKPFFWTHTHEISFWCSLTPTLADPESTPVAKERVSSLIKKLKKKSNQ